VRVLQLRDPREPYRQSGLFPALADHGGASRWNILGDRTLSDSMPEIFAPPPVLVAELLGEEGDAVLRKSAPIAWRILRARGLLVTPSPHGAAAVPAHAGAVPRKRWLAGAPE
jgi:tRNA(adenine34) deaminase